MLYCQLIIKLLQFKCCHFIYLCIGYCRTHLATNYYLFLFYCNLLVAFAQFYFACSNMEVNLLLASSVLKVSTGEGRKREDSLQYTICR